jgi:hypothetical protein
MKAYVHLDVGKIFLGWEMYQTKVNIKTHI